MPDRDFIVVLNENVPLEVVIVVFRDGDRMQISASRAHLIQTLPDVARLEVCPAMFLRLSQTEGAQQVH